MGRLGGNILKLELKKIRFVDILLASLIIPLLTDVFGLVNYMGSRESLTHQWRSLWTQISLFYFSFFFIPLMATIIANLWSVRHKAGLKFTHLSLKKNIAFVLAKFLLALIIISLCQVYFLVLFYLAGRCIGNFANISFNTYIYYIFMSTFLPLPIIGIFGALAIRVRSFGIIALLSSTFTMLDFATAYRSLKVVGLGFLTIEPNNFRYINAHDLALSILFALGKVVSFLYLSKKFLSYE